MLAFRLLIEDRKHSAIRKIMEVIQVSDVSDGNIKELQKLHKTVVAALRGSKAIRKKPTVDSKSPKKIKPRQSERLSSQSKRLSSVATPQTSNMDITENSNSISDLFPDLDYDDERSSD